MVLFRLSPLAAAVAGDLAPQLHEYKYRKVFCVRHEFEKGQRVQKK